MIDDGSRPEETESNPPSNKVQPTLMDRLSTVALFIGAICLASLVAVPFLMMGDICIATTLFSLVIGFCLALGGYGGQYKTGKKARDSQCDNCNYTLTGTTSTTCPECGHVIADNQDT